MAEKTIIPVFGKAFVNFRHKLRINRKCLILLVKPQVIICMSSKGLRLKTKASDLWHLAFWGEVFLVQCTANSCFHQLRSIARRPSTTSSATAAVTLFRIAAFASLTFVTFFAFNRLCQFCLKVPIVMHGLAA